MKTNEHQQTQPYHIYKYTSIHCTNISLRLLSHNMNQTTISPILNFANKSLFFSWKPEHFLALAAFLTIHYIRLKRRSNLPMSWPLLGMIPWLFLSLKAGIHEVFTMAAKDSNGTLLFRGPWFSNFDHVGTADPTNLEYMFKTNIGNFRKGQTTHTVSHDFLGDALFTTDDETWRWLRKVMNIKFHLPEFNKMAMDSWVELIDTRLLGMSETFMKQSVEFDLQDVLLRLFFDHSCIMAFGVDPGNLREGLPVVEFGEAFKNAEVFTAFRFFVPVFVWKIMRYFNLGWEREMKRAVQVLNEFAYNVIATRKKEVSIKSVDAKPRHDFLSLFLESKDYDEKVFPDNFLRDNCFNVIIAGADTTPVALSWFFWLIYKNPIIEERIYDEICQIVGKHTGLDESGQECVGAIFSSEVVKKMNYLHAALSETLRLYPPVALNLREVHSDDQFPDGFKLKKGIPVLISVYAMGRMESIWGADCREFKPERWLKDGVFVAESAYKFPAFNAGLRTCLGKDLAYYQMKIIAASIIHRYRVNVVENHPVEPKLSLVLHMKHGLKVTLSRREEMNSVP